MKTLLLFIVFVSGISVAQQPTLGLRYFTGEATSGYVLFTPEKNNDVYLVNECGEMVNKWTFSEMPALTVYLLENGNLLRSGKDSLEIRSWDNELVWSYALTNNGYLQHHDIEPLPNGNILCICRDDYSAVVMDAAGKDTVGLGPSMRLERIVELQPVGTNQANLVWEWRFFDHLIQDFDASKANFGAVADHPELLDINFDNGFPVDYIHLNAIDYNAVLDQIILSARHTNELYIIDHSTSTVEAAGHTGGQAGKGGDFLWRWGNPQVYRQGGAGDQQLFLQHDAKWIPDGFVNGGQISVFNNQGNGVDLMSMVHRIAPTLSGGSYSTSGGKFLPLNVESTWSGEVLGHVLYEDKKSGCHFLSNGNFMVTQSSLGQVSEFSSSGDPLWVYRNPAAQQVLNQFSEPISAQNGIFRGEKYESDYAGLQGHDLTSLGIIENENALSVGCVEFLDVERANLELPHIISPDRGTVIRFSDDFECDAVAIWSADGKQLWHQPTFKGDHIDLFLEPGIYFFHAHAGGITHVQPFIR